MAGRATNFPYVLARIHARQGARADRKFMLRLMPYRDFGGYLSALKQTPLAIFADGLSPGAGVHDVERHFRTVWRAYLQEIARWHGNEYSDAVDRLAAVVEIPVRRYLARGEPVQSWMPTEVDSTDELGPLSCADADLPTCCDDLLTFLPDPALRSHVLDACTKIRVMGKGGFPPIEDLRVFFERWFRTAHHPFLIVLAHIGCVACDLIDLRGALCARLLFPNETTLEGSD